MAREYAGIITRESERLSHLIDNVLDFARLERGKASYNFAEGHLDFQRGPSARVENFPGLDVRDSRHGGDSSISPGGSPRFVCPWDPRHYNHPS
jgi:hypothetical protein